MAAPQYGHYGRGKGAKAPDRWALPLSPDEHARQHRIGEEAFWRRHGINPHALALTISGLWSDMGDDAKPFAIAIINQHLATARPSSGKGLRMTDETEHHGTVALPRDPTSKALHYAQGMGETPSPEGQAASYVHVGFQWRGRATANDLWSPWCDGPCPALAPKGSETEERRVFALAAPDPQHHVECSE